MFAQKSINKIKTSCVIVVFALKINIQQKLKQISLKINFYILCLIMFSLNKHIYIRSCIIF